MPNTINPTGNLAQKIYSAPKKVKYFSAVHNPEGFDLELDTYLGNMKRFLEHVRNGNYPYTIETVKKGTYKINFEYTYGLDKFWYIVSL